MNSSKANFLNSIILIAVGSWGYFDGDGKSITALIPVIFGLFMPLNGAIERGNDIAVGRVSVMIISSVIALVFFIKSFIEARRKS